MDSTALDAHEERLRERIRDTRRDKLASPFWTAVESYVVFVKVRTSVSLLQEAAQEWGQLPQLSELEAELERLMST